MIQLTEAEVQGFNIIETAIRNLQAELQRDMGARGAYIALLEIKYDAVFNPESGQLKPKEKKK